MSDERVNIDVSARKIENGHIVSEYIASRGRRFDGKTVERFAKTKGERDKVMQAAVMRSLKRQGGGSRSSPTKRCL